MSIPILSEVAVRGLDSRIAKLEQALQVSAGKIVLQVGMTKITITNHDITLEAQGNIHLKAGGSTQIESSGTLTLKASKINEN